MKHFAPAVLAACVLAASCSPGADPVPGNDVEADAALPANVVDATPAPIASPIALPPVEPPAPGTPGGLPDDRTPVSEATFTETSAQGAANVVQTYYAHLSQGDYAGAWRIWSDGGRASGMSEQDFARSFDKYAQYDAQVGAPGEIEGAAGSLYIEVPVVVYGRLKSGEEVHMNGPVTLRRVNDVDGSTAEQRKWHVSAMGLKPRPR